MGKIQKKAASDKAKSYEHKGFETSDDAEFDDVGNEKNSNFLVEKTNYMNEKRNMEKDEKGEREEGDCVKKWCR